MLRVLALLLLAILVWRVTMLLLERAGVGSGRRVRGRRSVRPAGGGAAGGGGAPGEELVRCAACGTRVPASRTLPADAGPVCSEACRRRAAGGG